MPLKVVQYWISNPFEKRFMKKAGEVGGKIE